MEPRSRWPVAAWLALGAIFIVVATANGAGYRYGVSDQAFYIPVIARALDPGLFPRDASLIDAQGQLMVLDEAVAWFADYTGWPVDGLFLTGYLISLFLIWCGVVLIGTRVFASPWATLALGAAISLRHRIPRTSANSLEPYFHPRMLAFGAGLLAIGALLRRAPRATVALIAVSALLHPTTGLWFAVMVGTAWIVMGGTLRRLAIAGGAAALALLAWAATAGPLRDAAVRMDDVWLQAVASKDSLFATDWPAWAWAANLASVAVAWAAHSWRTRRGLATAEDRALVWGAIALAALFLATLPLVAAGYSLLVQFQISRVFWLIEFVAVLYTIAVIADAPVRLGLGSRRAVAATLVLVTLAAGRGAYIMLVERPERALFERRVPDSPWEEVMRWLAWQPRNVHVLADPGHAWKFGTSVRVSAEHDVFIEEVKDSALAIYSRDVAVRFVERTTALGDFAALDADRALALARRYDLHYLVAEHDVGLPIAYRNRQFRIYSLR